VILARYILREHIAPFLYALFVITFLFLIDFLIRILGSILSKGLSIRIVVEIIVLNLAWMLALSIPMAVLVSTLMAFGRFSSDNEITAMKSLGISPLKAIVPVFIVAMLLSGGMIYFNDRILPEANFRAAALRNDITRKKPTALITPRQVIDDFDNYKLWIDKLDKNTGNMAGVRIFQEENGKPLRYTYADSATMQYANGGRTILINLKQGENHLVDPKEPNNYVMVKFREQTVAMENVDATLERRERTYRTDREMSLKEMWAIVSEAKKRRSTLDQEYGEKIFDDLRALNIVMRADTISHTPDRLLIKPWLEENAPGNLVLAQVIKQEKDKAYLFDRYEQRKESELKEANQYLVEIHKKFAIPVACLVFVFIGAPLGIMARRGGVGTGTIYSLAFFVIYWVGMIRGEVMADRLLLPPWVAMWSPNLLIGIIGVYLAVRMARENYLGSLGIWGRILWVFRLFRKTKATDSI